MANASRETLTFALQGSAPQPYRVTFERQQSEVRAFCSCPAGLYGRYCKHRIQLLHGEIDGVVDGGLEELGVLAEWLGPSSLRVALQQLDEAELAVARAKQRVAAARKAVSMAMHGIQDSE